MTLYSITLASPLILTKFGIQGFTRVFFTLDEAAQIISCCKEWFLTNKTITDRFMAAEIQGGVLKEHLIPEDYLAPQKVTVNIVMVKTQQLTNCLTLLWA